MGGKARRDRPAFPLRPRAVTSGATGRVPGRGAGASSSRLARPRHRAHVPGSGPVSRCPVRLCVPAGPRADETVRISSACGSAPGTVRASCRCAGVGKASRTHQVQSRDTHPMRPEEHSELRRHGRSRREPRRARSPEDPPVLRHGRPSPLKKGGSSPMEKKKKDSPRFFKEKQNPSESHSCSPSAPRSTLQILRF